MDKDKKIIAIIGGGPAGMMSAIQASDENSEVFLFEKNYSLGKKLLITGKGRCNITNEEKDIRKFIQAFGRNGKFLFSAFSRFFNQDLIRFFEFFSKINDKAIISSIEPSRFESFSILEYNLSF